jgi:hypothetical protein
VDRSVSRSRFGYVMGLISVLKGDLPPWLAREVRFSSMSTFFLRSFWVGFDRILMVLPGMCLVFLPMLEARKECQGRVRRMMPRCCLVFNV